MKACCTDLGHARDHVAALAKHEVTKGPKRDLVSRRGCSLCCFTTRSHIGPLSAIHRANESVWTSPQAISNKRATRGHRCFQRNRSPFVTLNASLRAFCSRSGDAASAASSALRSIATFSVTGSTPVSSWEARAVKKRCVMSRYGEITALTSLTSNRSADK